MDLTVMHINKGNAHGTQGERSNPANSQHSRLLTQFRQYLSKVPTLNTRPQSVSFRFFLTTNSLQ